MCKYTVRRLQRSLKSSKCTDCSNRRLFRSQKRMKGIRVIAFSPWSIPRRLTCQQTSLRRAVTPLSLTRVARPKPPLTVKRSTSKLPRDPSTRPNQPTKSTTAISRTTPILLSTPTSVPPLRRAHSSRKCSRAMTMTLAPETLKSPLSIIISLESSTKRGRSRISSRTRKRTLTKWSSTNSTSDLKINLLSERGLTSINDIYLQLFQSSYRYSFPLVSRTGNASSSFSTIKAALVSTWLRGNAKELWNEFWVGLLSKG